MCAVTATLESSLKASCSALFAESHDQGREWAYAQEEMGVCHAGSAATAAPETYLASSTSAVRDNNSEPPQSGSHSSFSFTARSKSAMASAIWFFAICNALAPQGLKIARIEINSFSENLQRLI